LTADEVDGRKKEKRSVVVTKKWEVGGECD
jgi:hypothetical protein